MSAADPRTPGEIEEGPLVPELVAPSLVRLDALDAAARLAAAADHLLVIAAPLGVMPAAATSNLAAALADFRTVPR